MFKLLVCLLSLLVISGFASAEQNLALGKPYRVDYPASSNYPDRNNKLTDGNYALANFLNPHWVGYSGRNHRIIVVDLENSYTIDRVVLGFTKDEPSGVLFPLAMSLATSTNGIDWEVVSTNYYPTKDMPTRISQRTTLELDGKGQEARYVAVKFDIGVWVFMDEIEVFGPETPVAANTGPSHLSQVNFDQLNRVFGKFFTEELYHSIDSDHQRVSEETGFARDIMLIYDQFSGINWQESHALPYVAYLNEDLEPVDWFFDTFLFLGLSAPGGRNFGAYNLATKADWLWWLDRVFNPGHGFDAFESAVKFAGEKLGDPDHKVKVIVMIPNPSEVSAYPFDPDNPFYLTSNRVGRQAAAENRFNVVKWYIEEFEKRFQAREYEHLELIGYYWLSENATLYGIEGDYLPRVGDYIREKGLRFFWIPYFMAAGYSQWKEAGFDAVMLQPNYMFHLDKDNSRLLRAAIEAKTYSMGLEFEASPDVLIITEQRERYYDYLRTAVTLGYGNDILRGWYQDVKIFHDAARSTWPEVREVYDVTYKFVKGEYTETIQFE